MLGPHYDMLDDYEPHTTKYTLTVLCPPRPSPHWLPKIFTRSSLPKSNVGTAYTIRPSDYNPANPNYDNFTFRHLDDMMPKTVHIISAWFPADMRCRHVQKGCKCEVGCYVLEKGGEISRWHCKRGDCEGHVYCDRVMEDRNGVACFGKKGARMVCVER